LYCSDRLLTQFPARRLLLCWPLRWRIQIARSGWDQIDIGTIAAFTLDDRKRVTAEVLEFNEDHGELVVDVVSSSRSDPNDCRRPSTPSFIVFVTFSGTGRLRPYMFYLSRGPAKPAGLGYTQAITNRSLLDRAHREFSP
jgi:hypothetical protein